MMIKPKIIPFIQNERGFSLMEMMAVLAITAILGAFALPAYQDYMVRSRVTEGLVLAGPIKLAVAENAMLGASSLALGISSPTATANVSSLNVAGNTGEVTVTYTPIAGSGALVLRPTSAGSALASGVIPQQTIIWTCFAAGKTNAPTAATLDSRYAPADCR
jgi:type IV pilus assembly protein PilA